MAGIHILKNCTHTKHQHKDSNREFSGFMDPLDVEMALAHDTYCPLQEKDKDNDRMLKRPKTCYVLKSRGFKNIKSDTHRPHPDLILEHRFYLCNE